MLSQTRKSYPKEIAIPLIFFTQNMIDRVSYKFNKEIKNFKLKVWNKILLIDAFYIKKNVNINKC